VSRVRLAMNWEDRVANYDKEIPYPKHLFIGGDGRCVGTFIMGNNYTVKSTFYGGYPHGYLKRIKALFPDKQKTLHLFSGRVSTSDFPGITVDVNPALIPDYVDNAETLELVPFDGVDLVMADPPYSTEDSVHYGTPMVNRNRVLKALSKKLDSGAHIVWLDQVLPMYRKEELAIEGLIGMCKSTNHRFRMVVVFRRL
jgi:hypothetical protein